MLALRLPPSVGMSVCTDAVTRSMGLIWLLMVVLAASDAADITFRDYPRRSSRTQTRSDLARPYVCSWFNNEGKMPMQLSS